LPKYRKTFPRTRIWHRRRTFIVWRRECSANDSASKICIVRYARARILTIVLFRNLIRKCYKTRRKIIVQETTKIYSNMKIFIKLNNRTTFIKKIIVSIRRSQNEKCI